MANEYDTEQALAVFRCGGLDENLFLVHSWQGKEAVSQLYRFEIDLASADEEIDLEQVLGRRATLSVQTSDSILPWHGIVTEIRQTHRDETYAYYRAVLEPQLAMLRLFRQSRVYIHADAHSGGQPDLADIIRMVLEQIGLTQEGEISGNYTPDYSVRIPAADLSATRSNFICQFEETSLDFLKRRLEHEGVYFWFEQAHAREVVVFGNARSQQPNEVAPVFWRPDGELNAEADSLAIRRFDHRLQVQPKEVVLRDFSIQQPSLDLTVKTDVNPDGQPPLDRFDALGNIEFYGSHYKKQEQGERIATLRAQELASKRNCYEGEALVAGLRAGYSLQMHDHFRASVNGEYYVVEVQHQGQQSLPRQTAAQAEQTRFYHASFVVIPAQVQYRPSRITSRPRIVGFLSAIIEAEGDGQYAEMNEYGCYRIRFLFAPPGSGQQGDANSAWVRMATPYAGSQHGMNFPLLKGTEVLVSFLGGDPDRPVIVSAIPNEENPSIRNQDNASRPGLRTAGQNALEFEDKRDKEYARLSSPKAQSTLHLGNDEDHPAQTGIRLATAEHMGLNSRSYIQQVPGYYQLEIGKKGVVDIDPSTRLAVKAAMDKQKAKTLLEAALLPEATPATQLKALEARLLMRGSTLAYLLESLKQAEKVKPKNKELLEELNKKIKAAQESESALKKEIDNAKDDKEKLKKAVENEMKIAQQEDDDEDDEVINETKKSLTNGLYLSMVNSMTLGQNNTAVAGLNNSLALSINNSLSVGVNTGLSISKDIKFELDGQDRSTTIYMKKAVRDELKAIDTLITAANFTTTANTKSDKAMNWQLDCGMMAKINAVAGVQVRSPGQEVLVSPVGVAINGVLVRIG